MCWISPRNDQKYPLFFFFHIHLHFKNSGACARLVCFSFRVVVSEMVPCFQSSVYNYSSGVNSFLTSFLCLFIDVQKERWGVKHMCPGSWAMCLLEEEIEKQKEMAH